MDQVKSGGKINKYINSLPGADRRCIRDYSYLGDEIVNWLLRNNHKQAIKTLIKFDKDSQRLFASWVYLSTNSFRFEENSTIPSN